MAISIVEARRGKGEREDVLNDFDGQLGSLVVMFRSVQRELSQSKDSWAVREK